MIDVKQVRELIELMVEHGLNEIRVRQGETAVSLRRGPSGEPIVAAQGPAPSAALPAAVPGAEPSAVPAQPPEDEGLVPIPSPMVGTYYSASEPDAPPFVEAGTEVSPGTNICIIEAMKVFNEIKAEIAGTVERVLVRNEEAVEFGQPLMMVRPKN